MVSIIIPVYNVRDYIVKCLESVAAQTYTGAMECLIIDDCGQDDSILLAEEFVRKYKGHVEFKIFHHEKNRGLSAARNTGIKESKGDWLYFLDSDDSITPDCIETLASFAEKEPNVEMVIGDYYATNGEKAGGEILLNDGIYTDDLIHLYLSRQYNIPVWNKLLRKSFILENDLFFEEGLIHEDYLWSFKVACLVSKLAITEKVTYNYLIRETSLDHIPDASLHELHYGIAHTLISDFVYQNKQLKKNPEIYSWLEKDRYSRFMTPGWNQHIEVFQQLYRQIRKTKYWNLFDYLTFRIHPITKGAFIRSLHKLLPHKFGFKLYVKAYNKFGI